MLLLRLQAARAAVVVVVCAVGLSGQAFAQKSALYESIQRREEAAWEVAKDIWTWAEPGYQETKSSARLQEFLREAGFTIKAGVANMPTAFTATVGSGKPVVAILGEFDALPGLSQAATPYREPRPDATYGHACGHHLFGVASASAAIAIADQIRAGKLQGTIRYYGCPAEEGGSAKAFMARDGLFADCDVVLHWHPSHQNSAGDRSTLARMAAKFRFHGKAAHAAGAPEQGRSALDAVTLMNHAAELMREHTPEETRLHYVITAGGDAPNVVPAFAEVYYYIRHPDSSVVRDLYRRLTLCAKGAELATETKLEILYEGGILEILPNNVLAQVTFDNLKQLNDLKYTDEELQFAMRVQETLATKPPLDSISKVADLSGTVGKGSTDVGDVSWVVPTSGFTTACWVPGTPGHSWQAVAAGGTSIGRKGMHLAARVLAASAYDLFTRPELIERAKQEFDKRIAARKYETLLQPGQKPSLNYRNPPAQLTASGAE